jgi:hypothetical protein
MLALLLFYCRVFNFGREKNITVAVILLFGYDTVVIFLPLRLLFDPNIRVDNFVR